MKRRIAELEDRVAKLEEVIDCLIEEALDSEDAEFESEDDE
jgi:uncharacterized coiled-coil protein SlyX